MTLSKIVVLALTTTLLSSCGTNVIQNPTCILGLDVDLTPCIWPMCEDDEGEVIEGEVIEYFEIEDDVIYNIEYIEYKEEAKP